MPVKGEVISAPRHVLFSERKKHELIVTYLCDCLELVEKLNNIYVPVYSFVLDG